MSGYPNDLLVIRQNILQERVLAGLKRAKAAGKRLGRPTAAPTVEAKVRGLRLQGKGMIAIRARSGVRRRNSAADRLRLETSGGAPPSWTTRESAGAWSQSMGIAGSKGDG